MHNFSIFYLFLQTVFIGLQIPKIYKKNECMNQFLLPLHVCKTSNYASYIQLKIIKIH